MHALDLRDHETLCILRDGMTTCIPVLTLSQSLLQLQATLMSECSLLQSLSKQHCEHAASSETLP
jgi:hypothetical protein